MQKNLLRWKRFAFYVTMLHCLTSSAANGQISYTFTSTTSTYASVSGGSTIIGNGNNNALSSSTDIGFTFVYGCNSYTQFKASSNGWMSLGTAASSSRSTNDLTTTGNGPILAPLWDDLETNSSSSGVRYRTTGTAPNRVLTVEWRNMLWNRNADDPVITFQVKLYETSNVVEFIYNREAEGVDNGSASIGLNGGSSNTDFYSVNGSGVVTYGTETNNINTKPATNRVYRWTPNEMSYVSSTTTQSNTTAISKCNNLQQPIIGVQIVMNSCNMPMDVTAFRVNMTGTTNTSDVNVIRIYYTGSASVYAPIQEFGTGTPGSGNINITGSQVLTAGTHYFWIAYDVNDAAAANNVVDAQCTQVTVNGVARSIGSSNPSGSRTINNCTPAPGGITNPSFWIRGGAGTSSTTNNTKISVWNDQSGNNRHATNNVNNNRPTYYDNASKNMNFHPIVDFDEAGQDKDYADFMDISNSGVMADGNNPYEVYAVIVPGINSLTRPGKFLFAGEAGLNNFNSFDVRSNYSINDSWNMNDLIISNIWAPDTLAMFTFDYNYLQRETFKAGGSIGTRVSSDVRTSANLNNALGYQRTAQIEFYDGGIAEIITYANGSHGTTTRAKVETYLAIKYGVTLAHNYLSSNGTIVWNLSTNAGYNNNIIGIARDDNGGLRQKQSKSTSSRQDILTIYIGGTKHDNQANNTGSYTGGDRSFFMVGNNNDYPLNQWPGNTEKPAGICCRIFREWLVQKTNFTNTDLKLEFDFNTVTPGHLPLNAADLRLLVDADGDFSNATIYGSPSVTISASAGVATVTVPASLLANGSYFTLGSVSMNTILPLELKAFSGVCRNEAIQLKWVTATPAGQAFVIERSTDKVNFSPVGTVMANTSDSYSWTDQSPLPGTLYYRLKTTKDNGEPLYSSIIGVSSCNKTAIQLSTDPGSGESTLMLQLQQKDRTAISVYDLAGRRIEVPGLTGQRSLDKGVHYLPVRIPGAVAGMYFLHVRINDEPHVFRIIKH